MKNTFNIKTLAILSILSFVGISCADSSSTKNKTPDQTVTPTDTTLEVSRDSLSSRFSVAILRLESKIDTLDNKIEALGGNVSDSVIKSKNKLEAYKEELEEQADKIAAATDQNWADVKLEAMKEWNAFKVNVAETERDIEEYFNTRTYDK